MTYKDTEIRGPGNTCELLITKLASYLAQLKEGYQLRFPASLRHTSNEDQGLD
jgi:hypothetical protein